MCELSPQQVETDSERERRNGRNKNRGLYKHNNWLCDIQNNQSP